MAGAASGVGDGALATLHLGRRFLTRAGSFTLLCWDSPLRSSTGSVGDFGHFRSQQSRSPHLGAFCCTGLFECWWVEV